MSEERDLRAGEYVLGTLPAAERIAFEREMSADKVLALTVRDWEARLAPLNDGTPSVQPSAGLWDAIESRIDGPAVTVPSPPAVGIQQLRRSLRVWRAGAGAAAALAAGLALFILVDRTRPAPGGDNYVAVVNRGGELPAIIVRVDTATKTVHVRSVAAEPPAGRSLELWYIGAGRSPRSLGVVGDASRNAVLPDLGDPAHIGDAAFAVTVEPAGGSPTGDPTGPVVYSGKLIQDRP